jgi:hypothetical protein
MSYPARHYDGCGHHVLSFGFKTRRNMVACSFTLNTVVPLFVSVGLAWPISELFGLPVAVVTGFAFGLFGTSTLDGLDHWSQRRRKGAQQ